MKFRLEKHIPDSEAGPGGWYYEGTYSPDSIDRLCTCCFLLGGTCSAYDNIRVAVIEDGRTKEKETSPEAEGVNV